MSNRNETRLPELLLAIPDVYAAIPGFKLPGSRPLDPDKRTDKRSGGKTTVSRRSVLRMEVVDLADEREKTDVGPYPAAPRMDHRWRDGRGKMTSSPGERRQGILPTLSSWVRLVDSDMWDEGDEHQNPPTQRTVAGECGWLTENLDWIEAQQWANELEDDLDRMLRDMRRACGIKPERIYRCPNCRDRVQAEDNQTWYRCLGCARTWAMHNEINRLLSQQANTLTLKACAEDVGRPKASLEEWRKRGLINPVAKDDRGRYLFDVELVRRIDETVARRERKSA